jgi:1,4-dihydroxy-6-naphthoate synthase
LGGNAIKRELGSQLMVEVGNSLKESIQYALDHRDEALQYAMQFARDLDKHLANRFVSMYVNERTLEYGEDGREAIRKLLEMGYEKGVISVKPRVEFIG